MTGLYRVGRHGVSDNGQAELANFADNLDALVAAVKSTIDAGGRLSLLSTGDQSKPRSAFKRIYGASRQGENGYKVVFLPWSARPGWSGGGGFRPWRG